MNSHPACSAESAAGLGCLGASGTPPGLCCRSCCAWPSKQRRLYPALPPPVRSTPAAVPTTGFTTDAPAAQSKISSSLKHEKRPLTLCPAGLWEVTRKALTAFSSPFLDINDVVIREPKKSDLVATGIAYHLNKISSSTPARLRAAKVSTGPPVFDGVHLVLNFPRVEVVAVHQPLPALQSAVYLVLIGLHGAHKVLVLLQGFLCPGQSVRLVDVG